MFKKLGVKLLAITIFMVLWILGGCVVAAFGGGVLLEIVWLVVAFKISGKLDEILLGN